MRYLFAALCLTAAPVAAQEAPRVVADIAPIHAIVTQIMAGVGTPDQIIPTGSSPHSYAMRPSEGLALRNADLVVWVGAGLSPWLEEPLDTLSPDAARITLMSVEGTHSLPLREAEDMGPGVNHSDHAEDAHEDHGHKEHDEKEDEHKDHAHDDHADTEMHAGHDDEDADHEGHAHHGDIDPHGWLSPENGVLWAEVIAKKLGELDPANAETYMRNSTALREEVASVQKDIKALLEPLGDTSFMLLHDGSYYFEESFGLEAQAFIVPGHGRTPGPATIKAVRDQLSENPVSCAFIGVGGNPELVKTVTDGQDTRIAELDAMGDGKAGYAALLRNFGTAMAECLTQK